jgi:putative endonuclease
MFGDDRTTIEVGATGEDRAVDHLVQRGMRIVERNYRCRVGELDVVARDGDVLVFVEVRSRRSAKYGNALDAVSWAKRRKVTKVAQAYLASRRPRFARARFDVVAITGDELVHVRDAWRL